MTVKTSVLTPEAAKAAGFTMFNGGPHLAVEVPDGLFSITARMSNGKRITFAFVPYDGKMQGPAGCVDVSYDDAPVPPLMNGQTPCHVMHAIGFSLGRNSFDTRQMQRPTTLLTVLVDDEHYSTADASDAVPAAVAPQAQKGDQK